MTHRVYPPPSLSTVATLPADSIVDDPMTLAIARQIPEFAGMYFGDDGELVVALTDVNKRRVAEDLLRARLGSHRTARGVTDPGSVRFSAQPAQYSFIDLARYRTVLRKRVFGIPGVVSLDVKERTNRVAVGITGPEVEPAVRQLAGELGIPQAAVAVWQASMIGEDTHTLQGAMGNIKGGWQISPGCTLGFAARRYSDWAAVWVTNSHCTAVVHAYDGGAFTQNGTIIGYEIVDPPTYTCGVFISDPCRHSDAALISASVPIDLGTVTRTTASSGCESCSMPITVDHTNPTLQITSRWNSVIENERLDKIGQTTGWTYGNVEDKCADYEVNGWVKQCADRVDYARGGGDSGSPVFSLKANGTIELRGVHFGYIGFPYNDALMSNLGQIENDLGALVVFDPGPPSVQIIGPTQVPPGQECRWDAVVVSGLAPFGNMQWSGALTGIGYSIYGSLFGSGSLQASITDRLGRPGAAVVNAEVSSSFPPCSEA